jgi:type VI secretion system protein ImpK
MMMGVDLGPQEQIAAGHFRRFYASLLDVRDAIVPADPTAVTVSGPPAIDAVRTRLAQEIADLGYRHDVVGDAPVDAGYVLTAVADEVILVQCTTWSEYPAWANRPLEAVLYGTRLAGDRIFAAAEELIGLRRTDPRAATAILLALLTGFRGRYQGRDDHGEIARLKARLYELVLRRPYRPDDPRPYATDLATLEGPSLRTLPTLWPWLIALIALILAYFPISHLLWWEQARGVDALADAILADEPAPPGNAQ